MVSTFQKAKTQLPGVWALEYVQLFPSSTVDGPPIPLPFAGNLLGRAVFTGAGYMNGTVSLNHHDPATLSSDTWGSLTDDEILEITRPMSTYSGPWSLYESEGEIWLNVLVEIALNPSWEGKPQLRRKVEIREANGDEKNGLYLVLAPVDGIALPSGDLVYSKFVWRKMAEDFKPQASLL